MITFVIISVSDRVNELNELLDSIRKYNEFNCHINILYQDYLNNSSLINTDGVTNLFIYPERLGCSGARIQLLKHISYLDYQFYINLDDDIILTEHTKYMSAINKCKEPTTGFVLTNWARNEKLMLAKVPKMQEKFVKQALVYNGGGMVYNRNIAKIMETLEIRKTTFDNEWALTSYLLGYNNYRYLGSLAIHKICAKGGMRKFMEEEEHILTQIEYINYRYGTSKQKGWNVCIPLDSDLNKLAHQIHKINNENLQKK
jgi:hypothetical protein